ncbi:hypothetical protein IWQ60_007038, partial [Tieghemiomyces parasiticus]
VANLAAEQRRLEQAIDRAEDRRRKLGLVRSIIKQNKGQPLDQLISKWRRAAQQAILHLYERFRESQPDGVWPASGGGNRAFDEPEPRLSTRQSPGLSDGGDGEDDSNAETTRNCAPGTAITLGGFLLMLNADPDLIHFDAEEDEFSAA